MLSPENTTLLEQNIQKMAQQNAPIPVVRTYIAAFKQKYDTPDVQTQQQSQPGFWSSVASSLASPFLKVARTIQGVGATGVGLAEQGIGSMTGNKSMQQGGQDLVAGAMSGQPQPVMPVSPNIVGGFVGDALNKPVTPGGFDEKGNRLNTAQTAEQAAGVGAQIAPWFFGIPGGGIGTKLATGALAGGSFAGGEAAQNLGSPQDVFQKTILGSLVGAGTAGAGAVISKVGSWATSKLPQSLYNKIFKLSEEDWGSVINSKAAQDLQKTDPNAFNQLVKKGIVKVDDSGNVVVNQTMAQKALDANLKGSLEGMGKVSVASLWKSEAAVQEKVSQFTEPISVPNKQALLNFFSSLNERYSAGDVPQITDQATKFIEALNKGDSVSAEEMLGMRRFLDKIRIARSFGNQPMTKFNVTQGTVINLSNSLRKTLASNIPGFGPLMDKYSFWINALDDIKTAAVKGNNQAAINLIDTAAFGVGSLAGGPITGAAAGIAERAIRAPGFQTGVGSMLNKLGNTASSLPLSEAGNIGKKILMQQEGDIINQQNGSSQPQQ